MPRALSVIPASKRKDSRAIDTLILPHAVRHAAQKGVVVGVGGTRIELDLPEPARLRTDDALVLEDGALVEVVAEPEPLIEVRAESLPALARLAWQLGSRHVPVQILERRLRMRQEPAIAEWLGGLGLRTLAIEAPFEPDGEDSEAAHDHAHHDHDHSHAPHHHGHGHSHGHGHHDHACGCGHAHAHDHGKG